jgi:hypothetical protein
MTHLCCPPCQLRFTPAAAAHIEACPECGEPLLASSLRGTVGFRVFMPKDTPHALPQAAVAVSLPLPAPDRPRP